jgi:tRNA 2-thiocytidine biosynthesis protein TtcA
MENWYNRRVTVHTKAKRARPHSRREHLIFRRVGQAIGDLRLIEPRDRILVAVSGGKDSFALLHILDLHRRRSPFAFELVPVFLDAGWDSRAPDLVRQRLAEQGYSVEIYSRNIRANVEKSLRPGSNPCALCSRLRRGVLYDLAPERNCNKIALGHHLDDLVETLLMNLFFTGQTKSMAVRLRSDDGRNLVIRPLGYVEASLLEEFAVERGYQPVEIACPYNNGTIDPQRKLVARLIEQVAASHPRVRRSILAAMKHVRLSHLLDDTAYDRQGAEVKKLLLK